MATSDSQGVVREATRPIPIPKRKIKDLAKLILAKAVSKVRAGRPGSVGANEEIGAHKWLSIVEFDFKNVRGEKDRVKIILTASKPKPMPSRRQMFWGGQGWLRSTGQKVIQITVNGSMTRWLLESSTIEDELVKILFHEITHAFDSPRESDRAEGKGRDVPTTDEVDLEAYYNDPKEIRAYMQEIVLGASKYFPKLLATFGWKDGLRFALKNFTEWEEIEPHLTPRNRKKILKGIIRGLQENMETGRTASQGETMGFYTPTSGRVAGRYLARQYAAAKDPRTGDNTFVGIFIKLPDEIAVQFPSLGGEDKSPPHVTFLVVGDVPKARENEFLALVQEVLGQIPIPVKGRLHQLDFFKNPVSEKTVAHMSIKFSRDMALYRSLLVDQLRGAGFELRDFNPETWRPHTTLSYMDGLDGEKHYEKIVPSGTWAFDQMEVWGLSRVRDVLFGGVV